MVDRKDFDAGGRVGRVTLIGAGPGAPDLITVRGLRALMAADVVLFDALVDERLLDGVTAERIYVGKRNGHHCVPQEEIDALLLKLARQGKQVARLKGGDPTVLGRGGEEAMHLARHGVPFEFVPGVTSAVAGPALAGIPVTHRGVADSFTVLTAHRRVEGGGFSIPPYHPSTTLVLLMGVSTVGQWRAELREKGYPDTLPVAFVTEASTERQSVLTTTVGRAVEDAEAAGVASPSVAVVGEVVRLRETLGRGMQAGEETAGRVSHICKSSVASSCNRARPRDVASSRRPSPVSR